MDIAKYKLTPLMQKVMLRPVQSVRAWTNAECIYTDSHATRSALVRRGLAEYIKNKNSGWKNLILTPEGYRVALYLLANKE